MCAAVHVRLALGRTLSSFLPGQHDRGKGLVDLEQVDVVDSDMPALASACRGRRDRRRSASRSGRRRAPRGGGRGLAGVSRCVLHRPLRRDEHGARRRRRSGDATAAVIRPPGRERLQRRHLLQRRVARGHSSSANVAERGDLAVEPALGDRAFARARATLERELLHLLAADAPLLGDHLAPSGTGETSWSP